MSWPVCDAIASCPSSSVKQGGGTLGLGLSFASNCHHLCWPQHSDAITYAMSNMGYCTGCRSRCKKPGVPRGSSHVNKGHLEIHDLLPCCGHTAPLTRCIPAGFLRSEWPSHVLFISSSGAGFGKPRPRDVRSSAGFSPARGTAPQRVTLRRARGRRCSWAAPPAEGRTRNVASSGVL